MEWQGGGPGCDVPSSVAPCLLQLLGCVGLPHNESSNSPIFTAQAELYLSQKLSGQQQVVAFPLQGFLKGKAFESCLFSL